MATHEHRGLIKAMDEDGNRYILYPITKADAVDGLAEFLAAATIKASQISGLQNAIGSHTHTLDALGAAAASHTHTLDALGAAAASHTHTPASIGAAATSHNHSASQITSGTLSQARGGTGSSNLATAVNNLLTGGSVSVVKSVQYGVGMATDHDDGTVTITAVNVNKSIIIPTGFYPEADSDEVHMCMAKLTNSTTVTIEASGSISSYGGPMIGFYVVEFY